VRGMAAVTPSCSPATRATSCSLWRSSSSPGVSRSTWMSWLSWPAGPSGTPKRWPAPRRAPNGTATAAWSASASPCGQPPIASPSAAAPLYTWCAADTLMFTMILAEQAVAESTCPVTGEAIRLELSPQSLLSLSPPTAVITQRLGVEPVRDLRAEVCDHGLFFASPAAASGWAAEHPDGEVLSVAEAFDRSRATCEALGWLDGKKVEP
jgi:hypothetical protein